MGLYAAVGLKEIVHPYEYSQFTPIYAILDLLKCSTMLNHLGFLFNMHKCCKTR